MIAIRILKSSVLLLVMCVVFNAPSYVNAQQIDLAVSPPAVELLVKPDTQVVIPYTVTNRADSIDLKPLIKTLSIVKRGESVAYESIEKLPIKASFVNENSEIIETVTLIKGGVKKIFLQLDVSSAAAEGDYQLSFMVETQPESLDRQYGAKIRSQVASPLLIIVTKTGKTQVIGEISSFKIAGNLFDSFDSIPTALKVRNKGRNVLSAGGTLSIRGSLGESASYQLKDQNILAGSERLMTTKLAENDSTLILKGFFIGRYGVSASVTLADGTVQLNKSTSFFAFPFKIILFAVLGSFIVLTLLRKKR